MKELNGEQSVISTMINAMMTIVVILHDAWPANVIKALRRALYRSGVVFLDLANFRT